MKVTLVLLVFIQVVFTIFKVLYANDNPEVVDIDIPGLSQPNITFIDTSGGCGGFFDCTEYLGAVIFNIGAGLIFVVLFIINLLVFLFELFALVIVESVAGIDGAPWWLNLVFRTPLAMSVGVILWRMVRQGDAEA